MNVIYLRVSTFTKKICVPVCTYLHPSHASDFMFIHITTLLIRWAEVRTTLWNHKQDKLRWTDKVHNIINIWFALLHIKQLKIIKNQLRIIYSHNIYKRQKISLSYIFHPDVCPLPHYIQVQLMSRLRYFSQFKVDRIY